MVDVDKTEIYLQSTGVGKKLPIPLTANFSRPEIRNNQSLVSLAAEQWLH